jgi:hypothetical protein
MGLSDEEWEILPHAKKIELREKQYNLDHKLSVQKERNRAIQKEMQLEKEIAEQKRLNLIVQKGGYEDIININIHKAAYIYNNKVYYIEPTNIAIVRSETKKVSLNINRQNYIDRVDIWIKYHHNGNKITISFDNPKYKSSSRKIVILNSGNWHKEIKYLKSIRNNYHHLKDMIIGIRYISNNGY